jgi:hypothetical protein
MVTFSAWITNLTAFLPQYNDCNLYVSRQTLALPPLWLQKHTNLRAHDFAHSPILWHQPGLATVTCTWSWTLCGINPATSLPPLRTCLSCKGTALTGTLGSATDRVRLNAAHSTGSQVNADFRADITGRLERPTVTWSKNSSPFFLTRRLIISQQHVTAPCHVPDQFAPQPLTAFLLRLGLIYYHLRQGLLSDFPIRASNLLNHATRLAYLTLYALITLTIFGEDHKRRSSSYRISSVLLTINLS